jgi:hypothetical protein
LEYNFNNDAMGPPGGEPEGELGAPTSATPAETSAPATADAPQSANLVRFNSCRWQQPAEDGNAPFCTHREVKPYAGTAGFDADAWCPDCQYYKLRRAPKKKTPGDDYTY